jgi:hypothetical protein
MRLLDYILNIETIASNQNSGEGYFRSRFFCESSGVSGDGEGLCIFPCFEVEIEGVQDNYAQLEFPINAHSQNLMAGEVEFRFEVEAQGGGLNIGFGVIPIFDVWSIGFSGVSGHCNFPLFEVEAQGNANRKYELCENPNT